MFRKLVAVTAVALMSLVTALPVQSAENKSRMAPAGYAWTGCYAGANVGFGHQKNSAFDLTLNLDAASDSKTGFIGGGQIGCDHQFANAWVVGLQGMFDFGSIDGKHIYPGFTDNVGSKTKSLTTLTGRLGYAAMPQTLVYLKGGMAWAKMDYSDVDTLGTYSAFESATRRGWTLGGGVEYALPRNWSVFAEYNFARFNDKEYALNYNTGGFTLYRFNHSLQTFLVGVNYRFGKH